MVKLGFNESGMLRFQLDLKFYVVELLIVLVIISFVIYFGVAVYLNLKGPSTDYIVTVDEKVIEDEILHAKKMDFKREISDRNIIHLGERYLAGDIFFRLKDSGLAVKAVEPKH